MRLRYGLAAAVLVWLWPGGAQAQGAVTWMQDFPATGDNQGEIKIMASVTLDDDYELGAAAERFIFVWPEDGGPVELVPLTIDNLMIDQTVGGLTPGAKYNVVLVVPVKKGSDPVVKLMPAWKVATAKP